MNLNIHYADHLKAGICSCCDPADEHKVDPDILYVWNKMFKDVDLKLYMAHEPRIDKWHGCFKEIVNHIAESRFVALARHVAPQMLDGSVYPLFKDIDRQYIDKLAVPGGQSMAYDKIFDKGVGNVVRGWTNTTGMPRPFRLANSPWISTRSVPALNSFGTSPLVEVNRR